MMKSFRLLTALLAALCLSAISHAAEVGKPAPDFSLTGADGKTYALKDLAGKFVVLEWTNADCPFVVKHYGSGNMQKLQKELTAKNVVWLTINSSVAGKQGNLTAEQASALIAKNQSAASAYLFDGDGKVGKAYGAKTTPHMYLINDKGVLVYAGAIDSIPSAKQDDVAKATNYVTAAFAEASAGKPVTTASTTPYGCGVKY